MYSNLLNIKPKHAEGSNVRMANYKEVFDKGYLPNWSDEILTVAKVKARNPPTYKVKDEKGEVFEGNFYNEDLGRTRKDSETSYRIKILKNRTRSGNKEYYVKFIGYPDPPRWIRKRILFRFSKFTTLYHFLYVNKLYIKL